MSSIIVEHQLRFGANFSPSKPMSKASSGPFLVDPAALMVLMLWVRAFINTAEIMR